MTAGLFDYPQKAAFGRVLPKTKVYAFGKTSRRVRDLFVEEIHQIVWQFKLAPETTNLPAGPGVNEIQVFSLELKPGIEQPSESLLRCIDNAIAFPIFYEAVGQGDSRQVKVIAAYKRPSEADFAKWVVGEYFSTDWQPKSTSRSPLPVALNLAGLYEQMLRQLIPLPLRPGETLQALVARSEAAASKRRECETLEAQLKRAKQFNRKVEINAQLRTARSEYDSLTAEQVS